MLGVPEQMQRDFAKLAFAYFMTEVDSTERMEILPQVPEVLAELKRRGFATAVVTSRPGDSRLLLKKLAMVGLAAHLDQVVTQNTTSITRPWTKRQSAGNRAARRNDPGACVYVGDEPRDIMAATNAHFGAAIAVSTGPATFDHLLTHPAHKPDHVMRRWSELLGVSGKLSHYTNEGRACLIAKMPPRALEGIKVVELSCSRHDAELCRCDGGQTFADHGADAIKVEPPSHGAPERLAAPSRTSCPARKPTRSISTSIPTTRHAESRR